MTIDTTFLYGKVGQTRTIFVKQDKCPVVKVPKTIPVLIKRDLRWGQYPSNES